VKRGEVITVALPGDYGKPRPAVIVQADLFNETHASVTVAPVTSTLVNAPLFRLAIEPSPRNGLRTLSQVMVDKLTTVRRERIGATIGDVEPELLTRVNRALALWLGIAG
jgi:mRNA interferase MazF